MRIRHHLRNLQNSGILISSKYTLNYVPQPIICQQNQSRWDVITFNPSNPEQLQADGEFSFLQNESSTNPRSVPQSDVAPGACVQKGKEKVIIIDDDDEEKENREILRKNKGKEKVVVIDNDDDAEVILCAEIDMSGWQCGKPVKQGFDVCKHHWKRISPLVGRKRKQPPFKTLSSSRQRGGQQPHSESSENKKKQGNYFYYEGFLGQ